MNTGETIALIKAFGNGGGGSSLPAVTSADNGKVLAVQDGAWAAASNLFLVTVSRNDQYVYIADKTFSEITSAIQSGKSVTCLNSVNNKYYNLLSASSAEVLFYYPTNDNTATAIIIQSNNSVLLKKYMSLPSVISADNGSELIVKNAAWKMQQKKFVVTLTPTAADYSGTMDKTVAEINAAYEAGQQIWFRLYESASSFYDIPLAYAYNYDGSIYYTVYILDTVNNIIINAWTTTNELGNTYSTKVYSLTPAS